MQKYRRKEGANVQGVNEKMKKWGNDKRDMTEKQNFSVKIQHYKPSLMLAKENVNLIEIDHVGLVRVE